MEIPGKVSVYCPLVDAKGTAATLVAIADGYFHLEVQVKGQRHVMLTPVAGTALLFADPEPEREPGFEVEP